MNSLVLERDGRAEKVEVVGLGGMKKAIEASGYQ